MVIEPSRLRRRRFAEAGFLAGGMAVAVIYAIAWIRVPAATHGKTTINPALNSLGLMLPFIGGAGLAALIARRAAFRTVTTVTVVAGTAWHVIVGLSMGFLPLHDLFYCGNVGQDPCDTPSMTRATVAAALAATWTGTAGLFTFLSTRAARPHRDS
jgi:hypothetical protein